MTTVVFKVGGSVLNQLSPKFYQMLVQLKETGTCNPIIVHGGGPEINEALSKMNIETEFVDGLRVTTEEVLSIAEMVMSGTINKRIVASFQSIGGNALGLSGVDGKLLRARQMYNGKLGLVGEIIEVNTEWLSIIMNSGGIPVISPIAIGEGGRRYNVNGDMAAGAVAEAFKSKLILVSNIPGVIESINGEEMIHHHLTKQQVESKIDSGVIYGGMIPKVRSALASLKSGVAESVILNGLNPDDIKKYLEGKAVGTVLTEREVEHV